MSGVRIGRLFGIEIRIHPSWFIILALFAFTLATREGWREWGPVTAWVAAVIATLLFFATVLAHELGHSLVAQRQGIEVKSITLFILGGVASIEKEADSPAHEALMAGVGPLVSLAIGAAAVGLWAVLPGPETVAAVLLYIGMANLVLAVFNLLPGFPLDGGRILRALLWWRNHDFTRATRQATRVGQIFGVVLIGVGAIEAVAGDPLGGIWLAFVGWILIQAARASAEQAVLQHELTGVLTERIMSRPTEWISPFITLDRAAEGHFENFDTRCLPVQPETLDQQYDGLICGADLIKAPRSEWDRGRVRDVMVPAAQLHTVTPETPADEALAMLRREGVDRLGVVDAEGSLVGIVDETAIARFALAQETRATQAAG